MPPGPRGSADPPPPSARTKLVTAALELFAEQGFDATTVDQIASRAGVGRTTFFRTFPTKEAVVIPDHGTIQAALDARLATASAATAQVALREGAAIVLNHYLNEGPVARARYELTTRIPALRSAEAASQRSYERIFRTHARAWGYEDLDAELVASGVVTAHNHVLRRWLRKLSRDPRRELAEAIDHALRVGDRAGTHVVVVSTPLSADETARRIRDALPKTAES